VSALVVSLSAYDYAENVLMLLLSALSGVAHSDYNHFTKHLRIVQGYDLIYPVMVQRGMKGVV